MDPAETNGLTNLHRQQIVQCLSRFREKEKSSEHKEGFEKNNLIMWPQLAWNLLCTLNWPQTQNRDLPVSGFKLL